MEGGVAMGFGTTSKQDMYESFLIVSLTFVGSMTKVSPEISSKPHHLRLA